MTQNQNLTQKEVQNIMVDEFLPYAWEVISDRAFPQIDGFKPAQRLALYAMWEHGLTEETKMVSARLDGDIMKYHPHGTSAIYDTLVRMTQNNGSLIAPLVCGKGFFSKPWSTDPPGQDRYTYMGLTKLAQKSLFDGLKENAVDMERNYDNTLDVPSILPVKYPNIIVNTSAGVAVGVSSNIPSYGLKRACIATSKIIKGEINNTEQLFTILDAPEFTTGGIIHYDENALFRIVDEGKGTIYISAKAAIRGQTITITEIPYGTTVQGILQTVTELAKDGKLQGISNILNLSSKGGLELEITVKRGYEPEVVLENIYRMTPLRSSISFNTRLIIDGVPKQLNLLELLREWISFRSRCVKRVYQFRVDKASRQEHLYMAWEIIQGRVREVFNIVSEAKSKEAKDKIMSIFGLSEQQVDYILDTKLVSFTEDKALENIKKLMEIRADIKAYKTVVDNDSTRLIIIDQELNDIAKNYDLTEREYFDKLPSRKEIIAEMQLELRASKDYYTYIEIDNKGFIRKYYSEQSANSYRDTSKENVVFAKECNNLDKLLIFTNNGKCYKVDLSDMEVRSSSLKDNISKYLDKGEYAIFFDIPDNYDIIRTFVNLDTKIAYLLPYSQISGNREKYISLYNGNGRMQIVDDDEFFAISKQGKAVFINATFEKQQCNRVKVIKLGRLPGNNDYVFGCLGLSEVYTELTQQELDGYSKDYFVKIRHQLWEPAQ